MSAIAPKNASPKNSTPKIVVEKKDAVKSLKPVSSSMSSGGMMGKSMYSSAEGSTKDLLLEIIVMTGAALTVIAVTYLLFKPLFSGLFGSITDTITNITDLTSETLGTVTEVLGGVIEDASAAVGTVVGAINTTISSLGTNIGTALTTVTGTVGTVAGAITNPTTGTLKLLTDAVTTGIDGATSAFNTLVSNQDGIITQITDSTSIYITAFKNVIETASAEFQNTIAALREGADTIVQGVQDGIRYLVDPFVNDTYGIPAIANQMLSTITTLTGGITDVGTNIKDAIDSISSAINGLSP